MVRVRRAGTAWLLLTMLAGCGAAGPGRPLTQEPKSSKHKIFYQVTSAQLTAQTIYYIDETGRQQEVESPMLPWIKTIEVDSAKVPYVMVAAHVEPAPGVLKLPEVRCGLTVDDKVVRQTTAALTVECAGNLPPKS